MRGRAVLVTVCPAFCGDAVRSIRLAETALEPGSAGELLWERHCTCGCGIRAIVARRSVDFLNQAWDRIHGRKGCGASCGPAPSAEALEVREAWRELAIAGAEAAL